MLQLELNLWDQIKQAKAEPTAIASKHTGEGIKKFEAQVENDPETFSTYDCPAKSS